ncbi:MAG: uridine kinase [Candidatus Methylomirabilota bacterium]
MTIAPCLIGIGGPSGSGKSTLARYLAERLPDSALVLPIDAYYRDRGDLPRQARLGLNFDHPDAVDHELLLSHLLRLAAGEAVDRPVYRFASHTRAPQAERVGPAAFVLAEGLLALHWASVRRLWRLAVFVELPDGLCLERRLARDAAERGRSIASVLEQYAETVRPMRERYVMPTRAFADLVVSGIDPLEASARRILDRVFPCRPQ